MRLERRVLFKPAYDKRGSGYGIHGVEMIFLLSGPKGAIQFVVFTHWHLPHVAKEMRENASNWNASVIECLFQPMAADMGYHSPRPMYEDQSPISESCPYVPGGGKCYYDGSSLNAEPIFNLLVREGDEAVWKQLEGEYSARFEIAEASA